MGLMCIMPLRRGHNLATDIVNILKSLFFILIRHSRNVLKAPEMPGNSKSITISANIFELRLATNREFFSFPTSVLFRVLLIEVTGHLKDQLHRAASSTVVVYSYWHAYSTCIRSKDPVTFFCLRSITACDSMSFPGQISRSRISLVFQFGPTPVLL